MQLIQLHRKFKQEKSIINIESLTCFGACTSPSLGGYIQICHGLFYNAAFSTLCCPCAKYGISCTLITKAHSFVVLNDAQSSVTIGAMSVHVYSLCYVLLLVSCCGSFVLLFRRGLDTFSRYSDVHRAGRSGDRSIHL